MMWIVLVLAVLLVLELMCGAFFHLFEERFAFPHPENYRADLAVLEQVGRRFDPDLGWINGFPTELGERPRRLDRNRDLVSAYGDSFTMGSEVRPGQTWAEHLARHLEADVYNFGCAGYGMDQALLRFERDFARRPTPIAILAFISININRNVNVYRKFYRPEAVSPFTKPRFLLTGNALTLLPNPDPTLEALRQGTDDPEFLHRIGQNDWWYLHRSRLPCLRFPYLRIILSPSIWKRALVDDTDLWKVREPRRITELILERFIRSAGERGTRPVVMHLPTGREIRDRIRGKDAPPAMLAAQQICQRRDVLFVSPLGVLARRAQGRFPEMLMPGGHYSPRANRIVAGALSKALGRSFPELMMDQGSKRDQRKSSDR